MDTDAHGRPQAGLLRGFLRLPRQRNRSRRGRTPITHRSGVRDTASGTRPSGSTAPRTRSGWSWCRPFDQPHPL